MTTRYGRLAPVRRGPDGEAVLAYLRNRDRIHQLKVAASILFGAILSMIGPLMINSFLWLLAARDLRRFSFWPNFVMVALISLPIFFLIAAKVKGSIFDDGMDRFDESSLYGRYTAGRAAIVLIVLELANIGPRLMVYGTRIWRRRSGVGSVDLNRVAKAVGKLAESDGSIGPAALLLPGDPDEALTKILGFLIFYNIADLSKTGDRIWLASEVKEKLASTSGR